jgi:hypothetical protein
MPTQLQHEDYQTLKRSLPAVFQEQFLFEDTVLAQAYPLLNMICPDRDKIGRLQTDLEIPQLPSSQDSVLKILPLFQDLADQFQADALFKYRLPIMLSEFPIHSRAINKAIRAFNKKIEAYHQVPGSPLAEDQLEGCYGRVLQAIKEHGIYCDVDSLWQLLGMMAGWSKLSPTELLGRVGLSSAEPALSPPSTSQEAPQEPLAETPIIITELEQPQDTPCQNPFLPNYNYRFNGAGRLAKETVYVLINCFGLKIGGHSDAQAKSLPRLIPLEELHDLIRRQLSHRMDVAPTKSFQYWLETTLHQLGVAFIQRKEDDLSNEILVNPFFTKPISFLSPETILSALRNTLPDFASKELNPNKADLTILSQYLFELLQGFQMNPGQALGIGANWDGTVNMSNEAGTEAFKFRDAELGRRFKHLSLHRQGPSEAKMNAAIGALIEAQGFLTNFKRMSQIHPSEHLKIILDAIIDNLVTDLLPDPAYFENVLYQKFRKQYVVKRDQGVNNIIYFLIPCDQGTFVVRDGQEKQTPKNRRAGTLDVQDFPKNTTYSEQSRVCYDGNHLGPQLLQHAQALHKTARGHIVYDPIAEDTFLEDAFYGQVNRSDNGDLIPFYGVMPKNFDRHFNQEPELCASFVIRMYQSARIMEYCPTFRNTYEQIKTLFLPAPGSQPPVLPSFCSDFLIEKRQSFLTALASGERSFSTCHKPFYSLFKNLIYHLYDVGREDEHFGHTFLSFIHSYDTFYPASKARCEKLIRDLKVNRPVYVSPECLSRYDETLRYLQDITDFFYPKPTDALAQEIARQAKRHAKALLKSPVIQTYFELQKQNKQANLSRTQTPGMLYAALKHDGPSTSVADDYQRMHRVSFPSFYRDPDGTPCGEPQTFDSFVDGAAKAAGAGLRVMDKTNWFGILRNPFTEPFLCAKDQAALHRFDPLRPLWIAQGALKGFFWDGLAKGLWETVTTPFLMIADFFSWQYQNITAKEIASLPNPLAIPAAPANESNFRAQAAANTRDFLLHLLGKQEEIHLIKYNVLAYTLDLTKHLYPNLSEEDIGLYYQKLENTLPLQDEEWNTLIQSLILSTEDEALTAIFQRNHLSINKNLILAVYRCLTHPLFSQQPNPIKQDTQSFFSLGSNQQEVLTSILNLYQQTPEDMKQSFQNLFKFNGTIHKALQIRDQLLQVVQNFILNVFDEQALRDFLLDCHIDQLILELTPFTLDSTILRLPDGIKGPLHKLVTSNNPHLLEDYTLTDKQITLLRGIQTLINETTDPTARESLVTLCCVKTTLNPFLSVKEEAHNKWAKNMERELNHQLLSLEQAQEIFAILSDNLKRLPSLQSQLMPLLSCFETLNIDDNESLNQFYEAACGINHSLTHYWQQHKSSKNTWLVEAQTLLMDFLNVTMNTVVNARLAKGDIFGPIPPNNPLATSLAIESWLTGLHKNNPDFRSLLEQQVQQAPSLDHALWRNKCIFQVLETHNPNQKIANTGMPFLLRFWSQHKANVVKTGERYSNPKTGRANKSNHATLFQDCITLQSAKAKAQDRLPKFSIFSQSRKMDATDTENQINLGMPSSSSSSLR